MTEEVRLVDGRLVAPRKVVASVVGLTSAAIGNLPGLTKPPGGGLYVDEVVRDRIQRLEAKLSHEDEDSIAYQQLRETTARADKIELQNAKLRGELVEIADVSRALDRAFSVAQQRVLQIAATASPHLEGRSAKDIERELERYLREALEELAEVDLGQASEAADEDDDGP